MKLKLIPKPVLISAAVAVVSLVGLVLSIIFVGGALSDGEALNIRLKNEQGEIGKKLGTSSTDYKFSVDNREKFEAILASEKLVPHTRANAAQQFEALARARGIESLNYGFAAAAEQSLSAVKSQPTTGGYKVSVENVDLKVGASLDSPVYGFLMDLSDDFPGAVVIQSFTMKREPTITDTAIDRLSHGLSSGLVTAEVKLLWRTAQAVEEPKKK